MGGSLTIHNTTKITVVVTLENTGINHCKDAILPGGKHDYDLARFNYDINVEGADDNTLQNSLGSEPRKARNVRIQGTDRSYHTVSPVRLPGISAKKSDGKTKEFYITGSEISRDELKLELSTAPPPPEPEIRVTPYVRGTCTGAKITVILVSGRLSTALSSIKYTFMMNIVRNGDVSEPQMAPTCVYTFCTKSGESATEIISTSVGVVNSPYSTRLSDSHRQFESTSALDVPITMDSSLIMKSDETVLKQFGHTSSWYAETSSVHSEELFVTSGLFQPTLTVSEAATAAVAISKYITNTLEASVTMELTVGGSTTNETPSYSSETPTAHTSATHVTLSIKPNNIIGIVVISGALCFLVISFFIMATRALCLKVHQKNSVPADGELGIENPTFDRDQNEHGRQSVVIVPPRNRYHFDYEDNNGQ